MVSQIYPLELQLNKSNTSDTKATFFLDLHCLFLMRFFLTILNLKLWISNFKMVMFLTLHPMEFIFLNSSGFLEQLAMLLTYIWSKLII